MPEGIVTSVVARGTSGSQSLAALPRTRARGPRLTKFRDGRLAAKICLEQLGASDAVVESGRNGEPVWPRGFTGSISHSNHLSVAAVCSQEIFTALGIDIEDDRDIDGIEPYVIAPGEADWLVPASDADRRRGVISMFSAKEAIYKAFYPRVGRFFGFSDVVLHPITAGFRAEFVTDLDAGFPVGKPFRVHSEWHGDLVFSWTTLEPA